MEAANGKASTSWDADDGHPKEKAEARRIRNRQSAAASRERAKYYTQALEEDIKTLTARYVGDIVANAFNDVATRRETKQGFVPVACALHLARR